MTKKLITCSFLLFSSDEGWFDEAGVFEIQEFASLFCRAVRSARLGDYYLRAKYVAFLCQFVVETTSKDLLLSEVQVDINTFIDKLLLDDVAKHGFQ